MIESFEIGKYYKHTKGCSHQTHYIKIVGKTDEYYQVREDERTQIYDIPFGFYTSSEWEEVATLIGIKYIGEWNGKQSCNWFR